MEEDIAYIESICEVAQKYAPEYDEEKVCREILDLKRKKDEGYCERIIGVLE